MSGVISAPRTTPIVIIPNVAKAIAAGSGTAVEPPRATAAPVVPSSDELLLMK